MVFSAKESQVMTQQAQGLLLLAKFEARLREQMVEDFDPTVRIGYGYHERATAAARQELIEHMEKH
jgi:flagellar basal body rod protein FlgF